MAKDLNLTVLLDIYGVLLTEKQQNIMDMYFNCDNSLAEIAEELEIKRQSVRDSIVSASETLKHYENKLGFVQKIGKVADICNDVIENSSVGDTNVERYKNILSILEE